jgi:LysM repeat protein
MRPSTPARYLAPTALVAFIVVVVVLVSSSSGGTHRSSSTSDAPAAAHRVHHRFYRVHAGDTLSQVALKTGVSVQRLDQLNPRLDPNALRPGQRIRLVP